MGKFKEKILLLNQIEKGPLFFILFGWAISLVFMSALILTTLISGTDIDVLTHIVMDVTFNSAISMFLYSLICGLTIDCVFKRLKSGA